MHQILADCLRTFELEEKEIGVNETDPFEECSFSEHLLRSLLQSNVVALRLVVSAVLLLNNALSDEVAFCLTRAFGTSPKFRRSFC